MPEFDTEPTTAYLRERALRLLARREHSRFELTRKLGGAEFAREEIDKLLDAFEAKNWLSDQRFAESYVADHQAKAGSIKLAYELRQRGVPDSIVESVLSSNRDSELERARDVWRKKFGTPPTTPSDKAKQMRFMQGRGFGGEIIRRAIADNDRKDTD
ncbi:MAG TPA: recombination regulator RecX [Thiobacillus sp.]